MNYSKIIGFVNNQTITIKNITSSRAYGTILICGNRQTMDFISVAGKDNIEITHFGTDKSVTCTYSQEEESLIITLTSAHTHGFAAIGGTIAGDKTSVSLS